MDHFSPWCERRKKNVSCTSLDRVRKAHCKTVEQKNSYYGFNRFTMSFPNPIQRCAGYILFSSHRVRKAHCKTVEQKITYSLPENIFYTITELLQNEIKHTHHNETTGIVVL